MKKSIFALVFFFALAGLCFSAEAPTIPGTYISKQDSKEYLTLSPNGTFLLKQRKLPRDQANPFAEISGKYSVSGEAITLRLDDGGEASGKLKGNNFEDSDGVVWEKQGSKASGVQRPKRLKTFK